MKLITSNEVATIIGQTQRNVAYLVKADKITPALTLANGNYLFNESEIVLFNSNKKSNAKQ
jgi:hypothetical protein